MITTFISTDPISLDQDVNNFMRVKKRNLPVRTEMIAINDQIIHKATVFWDEDFNKNNSAFEEEVIEDGYDDIEVKEKPKSKTDDKLGALWTQKDGKVSGLVNNKKIVISTGLTEQLKGLQEGDKIEIKIQGIEAVVFTNKFKKESKHPDYIIYRKR